MEPFGQILNETHVNTQICLAVDCICTASLESSNVLITVSVSDSFVLEIWQSKSFPSSILSNPLLPLSLLPQSEDSTLLKNQMNIHSGICIHNGIVYKDKDEWTVDGCTECTCQVSVITPSGIQPLNNSGISWGKTSPCFLYPCCNEVIIVFMLAAAPPLIIMCFYLKAVSTSSQLSTKQRGAFPPSSNI